MQGLLAYFTDGDVLFPWCSIVAAGQDRWPRLVEHRNSLQSAAAGLRRKSAWFAWFVGRRALTRLPDA